MEKLVVGFLYIGTILTTLLMLAVTPTILASLAIQYCRGKRNARALSIALGFPAAYVVGGWVGWIFRPFNWSMSFLETLRAQTADHSIEYFAERVLLFVLMCGSVAVWLMGIGVGVWMRRSNRRA